MAQFEKQLERLEEISASIKKSDISMEEALKFFEEGIQLAKKMEKDLEKIETKIQVLMNAPVSVEDKPELDLFSLSAN
jgi:exodeoxyribonuclease VII small subunit